MVHMQIPQWVARFNKYVTTITVSEPRIVPKAEAAQHVTGFFRPIFPRLPFDQAVLLREA
jgi:hypothetical protein